MREPGVEVEATRLPEIPLKPWYERDPALPRAVAARWRHSSVSSASEWTSFASRVARVACCRNRMTVVASGRRPWTGSQD